jgi:hypothetical protein
VGGWKLWQQADAINPGEKVTLTMLVCGQFQEIYNRRKIAFKADKCMIPLGFDRLATGGVVRHSLTVIENFIARLLQ